MQRFHLYFDDSGSRDPDSPIRSQASRNDGMDCFAFGGILVAEEAIGTLLTAHSAFCRQHGIAYPLHSWAIRGGRRKFAWLKTPERAALFFPALEDFLLSLPIVTIACVVHRPGYVRRYKERYQERLWLMCQTAFCILVERAAKFAQQETRRLKVFYEESGKQEDRAVEGYFKMLKTRGLPFASVTSEDYAPLGPSDFRRIFWGKIERRTKNTPMMQIADLVLYPMAKAAYEPSYRPFLKLREAGKLIDCHLSEDEVLQRGLKYSCFDS